MGILEPLAAASAYQDLKRAHAAAMAAYRVGPEAPGAWSAVEAARDACNVYFNAVQDEIAAAAAAVIAARRARVDLHLSGFPPMESGRRRKALDRQFRFDGAIMTRFEKVEALQRDGWRLVDTPAGRRIESPCGRYIAPDELCGFGLDYFAAIAA